MAYDLPAGMEPFLDETAYYDPPNCTFPFGTHVAVVEVDEETGKVDLVQYVAVDDVGKKINPLIVDGQIAGGIVQGIGQALWEGAVYNDDGQLLSGSMMDYALPRALVAAGLRARRDGDALAGEPDGGQGRRRGRHDRLGRGRRQCRGRCALAARHPPPGHAVHPAARMARDAGRRGGAIVIPASFEYVRAASVDEALERLAGDPNAKAIAGGQSLIPLLKFRLAQPGTLVDIGGLRDLDGIAEDDGGWRIGALTTYRQLLDHDGLAKAYPALRECVESIGDVQVRNRGTVGGSLAHADPASDLPAMTLALDGEAIVRSSGGERRVPLASFFQGAFTTALEQGELIAGLALPKLPPGAGTAWESLEVSASGYAIAGVAAVVADTHGVYGSASIDHVRVGITGVGDVPYRATAVEEALVGSDCNQAGIASAAPRATDGQTVASDIHADAEYRAALAVTMTRRALERAKARTG